jgi:hypothetical protein
MWLDYSGNERKQRTKKVIKQNGYQIAESEVMPKSLDFYR